MCDEIYPLFIIIIIIIESVDIITYILKNSLIDIQGPVIKHACHFFFQPLRRGIHKCITIPAC